MNSNSVIKLHYVNFYYSYFKIAITHLEKKLIDIIMFNSYLFFMLQIFDKTEKLDRKYNLTEFDRQLLDRTDLVRYDITYNMIFFRNLIMTKKTNTHTHTHTLIYLIITTFFYFFCQFSPVNLANLRQAGQPATTNRPGIIFLISAHINICDSPRENDTRYLYIGRIRV